MKIVIPYNKKNMLPLVEDVMVVYHTQKTNITLDLSRVIFFSSCGNLPYQPQLKAACL